MNGLAIRWRDFGAALLVLAIGVLFLLWAQSYPPGMSAMPTLVAWALIVLALIDAAAQFDTPFGRVLRRATGMDNAGDRASPKDEKEPGWGRVGLAMTWMAGYIVAIIVVGFLIATPVYIFLYMFGYGGKPLRTSAVASVVTSFAIWLTFEVLFKYPLYPGLIFAG